MRSCLALAEVLGHDALTASCVTATYVSPHHLQVGLWKRSMLVLLEIMDVLSNNPNIILDDTADASEERTAEPQPNEKGEIRVWGNLVAFVERLDDEMFKSLQVGLELCSLWCLAATL